jgi:hypothetical protein
MPHKKPSPSVIYKARRKMDMSEHATNSMQTVAREDAINDPFTYLNSPAMLGYLEDAYGVPCKRDKPPFLEVNTVGRTCTWAAPMPAVDAADSLSTVRKLNPATTWWLDELMGKTVSNALAVCKPRGTKNVAGRQVKAIVLQQGYTYSFAPNGNGDFMPVLMGFRSKKATPGKPVVYPFSDFNHLFYGDQDALMVVYHADDHKHLPWNFETFIVDPTLAAKAEQISD